MESLFNYLIYLIAIVITLPIIATWFVYVMSKKIYKQTWKAVHTAVNWTTIFYIIAVIMILLMFFNKSFIGIISIFLMIMLSIIVIVQWKLKTEVILRHGLKILWRVSFLVFSFSYTFLVIFGIVHRMFYY